MNLAGTMDFPLYQSVKLSHLRFQQEYNYYNTSVYNQENFRMMNYHSPLFVPQNYCVNHNNVAIPKCSPLIILNHIKVFLLVT